MGMEEHEKAHVAVSSRKLLPKLHLILWFLPPQPSTVHKYTSPVMQLNFNWMMCFTITNVLIERAENMLLFQNSYSCKTYHSS